MGKKKSILQNSVEPADKQQMIAGTEPPPLPENVATLRDRFTKARYQKSGWSAREKGTGDELMAAMDDAGIDRVLIDDGKNWLALKITRKLTNEARKTSGENDVLEDVD